MTPPPLPPPLPPPFQRPKRPRSFFKGLFFIILSLLAFPILPLAGYIAWVRLVVCKDVLLQTIHSGLDFEIWQTGCDPALSVFVSKGGRDRSEIFTYAPDNEDLPLIVFHPDEKRIEISVGRIGQIDYKANRWADMTIEYHIAKVDYPRPDSQTSVR